MKFGKNGVGTNSPVQTITRMRKCSGRNVYARDSFQVNNFVKGLIFVPAEHVPLVGSELVGGGFFLPSGGS